MISQACLAIHGETASIVFADLESLSHPESAQGKIMIRRKIEPSRQMIADHGPSCYIMFQYADNCSYHGDKRTVFYSIASLRGCVGLAYKKYRFMANSHCIIAKFTDNTYSVMTDVGPGDILLSVCKQNFSDELRKQIELFNV